MKRKIVIGLVGASVTTMSALAAEPLEQFRKEHCTMCHSVDHKIIGPSYKDIAAKYKGDVTARDKLEKKVKEGSGGTWGSARMPAHPKTSAADITLMVKWILAL